MMNAVPQKDFCRGLHNFIQAVHHARSKEEESKVVQRELAKVRNYFKEEKVPDGYQRRKYVSKLLYMYVYGYDLDFGHMEAIQLLSMPKYHEKHIGYLGVQLLLGETHEMLPLIVNSVQEDLSSRTPAIQCLALAAIANIGSKELTETLAPSVLKLLLSAATPAVVKKKAAMAYVRLLRKNRGIFQLDPQLPEKLVALLDDLDMGVVNGVMALVLDVVTADPGHMESASSKVVKILGRVIGKEYGKDYTYHNVPHPWLQVRCLRFLRFVPPQERAALDRLTEVLNKILSAEPRAGSSDNNRNAQNAVLFEAIALVNTLAYDAGLQQKAVAQLGKFVVAKETNLRYLALEALGFVCDTEPALVRKHQKTVLSALKEIDVSIRRRALDLIYRLCDKDSSAEIIHELLVYLMTCDESVKEEVVVKVAILAERFLEGTPQYVDVLLQLIAEAGDHVSDETWFRLVRAVVNREEVQEYAAKAVFAALKKEPWHETMVKVGGYLLGEFGYLISEAPGSSPVDQFRTLHSRFSMVSGPTKALLLSTYAKFVNAFPETVATMREVFSQHRDCIDAEIQQRACEYLALTGGSGGGASIDQLMQSVLEPIPPWDEAKVAAAHEATEAALEERDKKEAARAALVDAPVSSSPSSSQAGARGKNVLDELFDSTGAGSASTAMQDLASLGINLTSPSDPSVSAAPRPAGMAATTTVTTTTTTTLAPQVAPRAGSFGSAGLLESLGVGTISAAAPPAAPPISQALPVAQAAPVSQEAAALTPEARTKVKQQWLALCASSSGLLFQDEYLQIGVKSEFQGFSGRLVFFFGNVSKTPIQGLTTTYSGLPQLTIQATALPQTVIGPSAQVQQAVHVTCTGDYNEIPTMRVGYVVASKPPVAVDLPLPVLLTKFISSPAKKQLAAPEFIAEWKALGEPDQEVQQVFKAGPSGVDVRRLRSLFSEGFKMLLLDRVDPKDTNLVLIGQLHTQGRQDLTVLVRLETNADLGMYRMTIRSGTSQASAAIACVIMAQLSA